MGKCAAEILVKLMKKTPDDPEDSVKQVIVLPNELRIRESTARFIAP